MSDDDLSALTPEQITAFHRAAATLKDEDFSPEEMAGIRKGWLGLVKERAYAGPGGSLRTAADPGATAERQFSNPPRCLCRTRPR